MKNKHLRLFLTVFAASFVLISCIPSNRFSEKITSPVKYYTGDGNNFASPDYDDSGWKTLENKSIEVNSNHYAWIRAELSVPSRLQKKNLWLCMDRFNAAADFYADGVYIGSRGNLPPETRIRVEENTAINIPLSAVHNGKVLLAVRLYCASDKIIDLGFYFANDEQAYFENVIHNQFGPRFFLILTYLCIFIMLYSFAVFLGNRSDRAYLLYSICMAFIIPYFLDIGSEVMFMPYNLQRSLCRACLPVSMMFMGLFLNRFFNQKGFKVLFAITVVTTIIIFTTYFIVMGKQDVMDMTFNVMLLPVVAVIVYGFVTTTKALKMHVPYAINLFVAFSVGSILALHDVVYMVIGKVPFMWTQALAFFAVDLSIFITLSMRSARSQHELIKLAKQTEKQHKKLTEIFTNAKNMAVEMSQISDELADSVQTVTQAARTSSEKVDVINQAIKEQSSIHEETEERIKALAISLQNMNSEFDNTTESIRTTADGTKSVMDGIANVSEGIMTAENFTRSLNSLTTSGSDEMKKLLKVIDSIQESSKEILSVVTTLDAFAHQTDLLAMNAAIEAAHTGDKGKGFAVIAHEIKALAANSSTYASKIGEIITTVIQSIEQSVELTGKVNQTFANIQEGAGQSVEKVSAAAQSIRQQVDTGKIISKESEQMAGTAGRMKESVAKQSEHSEHVLLNMERLTQASQKVHNASSEISSETQALAVQVAALRTLTNRTRETAQGIEKLMLTEE